MLSARRERLRVMSAYRHETQTAKFKESARKNNQWSNSHSGWYATMTATITIKFMQSTPQSNGLSCISGMAENIDCQVVCNE